MARRYLRLALKLEAPAVLWQGLCKKSRDCGYSNVSASRDPNRRDVRNPIFRMLYRHFGCKVIQASGRAGRAHLDDCEISMQDISVFDRRINDRSINAKE